MSNAKTTSQWDIPENQKNPIQAENPTESKFKNWLKEI